MSKYQATWIPSTTSIQLAQIIHSDAELTYSVFTLLDQTSSQLVWLNAIEC